MADETMPAGVQAAQAAQAGQDDTQPAIPAASAPTGALALANPLAGLIGYIVQHRLLHDGREYLPGAVFQHADPATIAALRSAKAIALPTEVQAADEVAQRMATLEAQLAAAQAENARLVAAQAENARLVAAREQQSAPPASGAASGAASGSKGGK